MKRTFLFLAAAVLLGAASQAYSADPAATAEKPKVTAADKTTVAPDVAGETVTTTVTAKVVDVNHHKQWLVLEGPGGKNWAVKVDTKVKNFKNIKKGDMVKIQHSESILWSIVKPAAPPGPSKEVIVVKETAPVGKKPALAEAEVVNVTAVIENVDKATKTVWIKGPDGNLVGLKVNDLKALEAIKPGETIVAKYTEALVINVEAVPK